MAALRRLREMNGGGSMGDFLLVILVAATFALGYYVMKGMDRILDANDGDNIEPPVLPEEKQKSE